MKNYIAARGQTAAEIAGIFGVDAEVLAANNGVPVSMPLAAGTCITVLNPAETHTVREGETLQSIAGRYGTTVRRLYCNNLLLQGRDVIYPGQELIISWERSPIGEYQIGGYAYPFISRTLLDTVLPFMNYLMPFTYGFTPEGELIELDDGALLSRAEAYGTYPVMHLSTLTAEDTFSPELAENLLDDRGAIAALTGNILRNLSAKGYYALDVDFEYLSGDYAVKYAEFIGFLRRTLNAEGYPVMCALAPKVYGEQPGQLYAGHDYALLGENANCVLVMTYEWGYSYGPPMPVSPIGSVKRVLDYAVSVIDPGKIFMGISNYGYDFMLPYTPGKSFAPSLSTVEAYRLAAEKGAEIFYDRTDQTPYFRYSEGGNEHIVFFEDTRSISAKLALLPEYGLRGGLYWNLMRQNPQNLISINTLIDFAHPNLF